MGVTRKTEHIGGDAICMAKTMPKTLDTSARQKRLLVLLEDYVKSCRPPPEADAKKTLAHRLDMYDNSQASNIVEYP